MFIDDCDDFAFLFHYQPVLSVGTIFAHRVPSLGEQATLLLGVLALSVRVRTLGYCLGAVTEQVVGVDVDGSILIIEPAEMHACSEDSECCAHGVHLESLFSLLTRWSHDVPTGLLTDAARVALVTDSAENALEVGMHVVNQIVTPSRIHLDVSIGRLPLARAPTLPENEVNEDVGMFTRVRELTQGNLRRKFKRA
jgi:hypothetical protein